MPLRSSLALAVIVVSAPVHGFAQTSTSTSSAPGGPHFTPADRPPPAPPPPRRVSNVPDPADSVLVSGVLGLSAGSGGARFVIGAGVGYAITDGIVPGARGLAVLGGGGFGGELVMNLTLTIPANWYILPFGILEAGGRWLDGLSGWLLGAGAGVRLGWASSRVGFRLGWIYRRFIVDGTSYDVSTPLFSVQYRW